MSSRFDLRIRGRHAVAIIAATIVGTLLAVAAIAFNSMLLAVVFAILMGVATGLLSVWAGEW